MFNVQQILDIVDMTSLLISSFNLIYSSNLLLDDDSDLPSHRITTKSTANMLIFHLSHDLKTAFPHDKRLNVLSDL